MFHIPDVVELALPGVLHITPHLSKDTRGFFAEIFSNEFLQSLGITDSFIQTSVSFSRKGVLRGLHFQKQPASQAKLVRCSSGSVFDVVVDGRADSPTFGKHVAVELNGDRQDMLYIPSHYAHGFYAQTDAVLEYRLSYGFSPEHAGGFRYDDPAFGIFWPDARPILSEKDASLPLIQPL